MMSRPTWHLKSIGAILFAGIFATLTVWQPQSLIKSAMATSSTETLHNPALAAPAEWISPQISARSAVTDYVASVSASAVETP